MGLLEQMEEDKKRLAEMLEGGIVENEEDEVLGQDEETEQEKETVEDEVATEEVETETETEKVEEEEKPLEGKDYARMRRERREARKAELEAQQRVVQPIAEQPKTEAKQDNSDPEPDRATQYPQWLEWNARQANLKAEKAIQRLEEIERQKQQEQLIQTAVEEFTAIESEFKKIEPKYDEAAGFYLEQMARSIKLLYPTATQKQIAEEIKIQVLNKAAYYHQNGLNPAEELFEEAVALGFNPDYVEEKQEVKKDIKPNIEKLARNRERNAGMGASGGVSKRPTMATAANLTTGEWMKLSKAEKDAILKGR